MDGKFTVGVYVRNARVQDAIRNILSQTFPKDEMDLILVDYDREG